MTAIEKSGHSGKIELAMDVAASEFFIDGKYDLDFKNTMNKGDKRLSGEELLSLYKGFVDEYPIVSIEDPFD
jgi:enolase